MSVSAYSATTKSITVTSTSADASADVVYTCPTNYDAEIVFLAALNGAASNNINVQFYVASTATWKYLLLAHTVAANSTYTFLSGASLFLSAGDKIAAFKAGGTFHVALSAKQFYNPAR